jgi:hypothetical protein
MSFGTVGQLTGAAGGRRAPETRQTEDTVSTMPGNASSNLPGKPPVVDLANWQAVREELLVREKEHTREGDAIAAARRRLPMVEFNGADEVTGVDGPVPFVDLFQGHDELVTCGATARRTRGSARAAPLRPGT